MDFLSLLIPLAVVVIASVMIMKACNSFDEASSYLGRNMPAGVKGATINAIGSSLPELLTTACLLFLFHDQDGFSAGIATCAGSAVFNAIIIPAACILAVTWWGKKETLHVGTAATGGLHGPWFKRIVYDHITVDRKTIIRDGAFFIAAEVALIYFLGDHVMAWWMGGALMLIYVVYFSYLMVQTFTADKVEREDYEPVGLPDKGPAYAVWQSTGGNRLRSLIDLDFNGVLFYGRGFNAPRAWAVLGCSIAVIAVACYALAEAVVNTAAVLQVPTYFTAVVLAAAATSVPDTVLSMKDAMNGNYDDAVSNAIGSNIFDITVALGLPLLAYGLVYGDVTLSASASAANVQELRIALLGLTAIGLAIFLKSKVITKRAGFALLGLYGGWMAFILYRAIA